MREQRPKCAMEEALFPFLSESTLVPEGSDEPGSGISPVSVGSSGGDVEGGRGLRDGQAGEVAELHHLGRPQFDGREPVERFIEGEETFGSVGVRWVFGVKVMANEVSAVRWPVLA